MSPVHNPQRKGAKGTTQVSHGLILTAETILYSEKGRRFIPGDFDKRKSSGISICLGTESNCSKCECRGVLLMMDV